ncbi:MAG: YggT family protein [Pseudonocardiaceae bacterium]
MILQQILCAVITIYFVILLIRIVLSWVPAVPDPILPLARGVRTVTDPLLVPLRGVIPPVQVGAAALDLSPLVIFFVIAILRSLFC